MVKKMRNMYDLSDDNEALEMYGRDLKTLWKEEIAYTNHQANISASRARAFIKASDALMKLNVNDIANWNITKTARRTINESFNSDHAGDIDYIN